MHEYSIVSALLDRADDAARQHGATAVQRIRVQIGELSGVETGLLQEAFSMVRADTVSAEAEPDELVILALTAATVGVVHTLLGPDHYVPFTGDGADRSPRH